MIRSGITLGGLDRTNDRAVERSSRSAFCLFSFPFFPFFFFFLPWSEKERMTRFVERTSSGLTLDLV